MRQSFVNGGIVLAAFTLAAHTAAAQIAPGSELFLSGFAAATDIGSPGVVLDFGRVVASATGNTGTFASLNRHAGPGVSGSLRNILVGNGPQNIPHFLTMGGYRFAVRSVPSGPFGQDDCYVDPAVGQQCTPYQSPGFALSPFYLVNSASTNPNTPIVSTASFDFVGSVTGPGGATADVTGTISSTFDMSYQETLYTLEQQGLRDVPFTATFVAGGPTTVSVAAVPEPATWALVVTGLAGVAGMAGLARRRRA